ncbi:hypothetical protein AVEN_187869-1 [Araneus ventricosus]|uniref:Uncharacterized protein n=1 Tax=Araneus ventricosus TaxID=182803 RepID=A0A4Y2CSD3_ARAVE|nr:hypothetical protein AVEN_187869-1 [Araneus ventricosus]
MAGKSGGYCSLAANDDDFRSGAHIVRAHEGWTPNKWKSKVRMTLTRATNDLHLLHKRCATGKTDDGQAADKLTIAFQSDGLPRNSQN